MIRRLALPLLLLPALTVPGLVQARVAQPAPVMGPPAPLTPPAMCEAAIAASEKEAKLPSRVLASIALRESGRLDPSTGRARPWPWTINFEGTGRYFPTQEEAIAAVKEIQAAGGQSIDVGCMQVNLMHHPAAFASLEDAFDPKRNATYSARFLKNLFASLGDWGPAIGAYHSRTPGRSEAYRDQVVATWRPTDPAVLARLTLAPAVLPDASAVPGEGTAPKGFLPVAGVPSAMARKSPAPVQISPGMAYRAFAQVGGVYQSFQPVTVAYADFTVKAGKARGRPLDLRVSMGGMGGQRGLVVPKGVIDRPGGKPFVLKFVPRKAKAAE